MENNGKVVLSRSQINILEFIFAFQEEKGWSPTVREIRDGVGLNSPSTVQSHLNKLRELGVITTDGQKARTTKILGVLNKTTGVFTKYPDMQDEQDLHEENPKKEIRNLPQNIIPYPRKGTRTVPILGKVTAGVPNLATEDLIGEVSFSDAEENGEYFALRIKGDSMCGIGIMDGDTVIVQHNAEINSGDIVIALIDDEATCKRLIIDEDNDEVWLHPENPEYKDIDGRRCEILGVVKGVQRTY